MLERKLVGGERKEYLTHTTQTYQKYIYLFRLFNRFEWKYQRAITLELLYKIPLHAIQKTDTFHRSNLMKAPNEINCVYFISDSHIMSD